MAEALDDVLCSPDPVRLPDVHAERVLVGRHPAAHRARHALRVVHDRHVVGDARPAQSLVADLAVHLPAGKADERRRRRRRRSRGRTKPGWKPKESLVSLSWGNTWKSSEPRIKTLVFFLIGTVVDQEAKVLEDVFRARDPMPPDDVDAEAEHARDHFVAEAAPHRLLVVHVVQVRLRGARGAQGAVAELAVHPAALQGHQIRRTRD